MSKSIIITTEMTNEERLYSTILNLDSYKEIIGWTCYLNPNQPLLNFFDIRKTNEDYVKTEIAWYNSMRLDVSDIETKAKIWSEIKSRKNKVNSNYGWCIFSEANGYQFNNCIEKLVGNPDTRQACMIYTRPSMHLDAIKDGMKDFMCTNYVQVFIRDRSLKYIVHQRSCDFVYGFFNDFAWHCYVYKLLWAKLKSYNIDLVDDIKDIKNTILYIADSLHIYPKHYEMINKIALAILNQPVK